MVSIVTIPGDHFMVDHFYCVAQVSRFSTTFYVNVNQQSFERKA